MAVSDGVFDEGTFDNATFNNITRGETVSVEGQSSVSTTVSHGRFQTNSTSVTENIDFEPDVIQFRITSTNTNFDNSNTGVGRDFGWGHGFATFAQDGTVNNQYALSHGSGSTSTNGHFSESTSSYSVFQIVTDSSGDNLQGRIRGKITSSTSDSFTVSFDENSENQQVLYTAYKFPNNDYEVGFFQAESTNTTQSITSPGFKPNFLRLFTTPNVETMNSTVNELGSGTADLGWGQGVAVENSAGVKQGSLAVSQYSSNIDGHSYTSSGSEALTIAYMTNKQSLNGTTKASASFTSNGFDMNYNTTTNPNNETPVVIYLAAKAESTPDAGFQTTPVDSTGPVSYSSEFELDNISFFASNTVPSFGSESGVSRQTWGWMYGQANSVSDEQHIGFYSNSDSVNGHAFSAGTPVYRQLYVDNNGGEIARYEADLTSISSSSFTLDYSQVVTSSDASNSSIESDTEAFVWYGFESGSGGGGSNQVSFKLEKPVSESLGLQDVETDAATLFRLFSESVILSDSDIQQLQRRLTQNTSASDGFDRTASYFRSIADSLDLTDEQVKNLLKVLQDSFQSSDVDSKKLLTSLNAQFTVQDAISSTTELFRDVNNSFTVTDLKRKLVRRVFDDGVDLQDAEESVANLARQVDEPVVLSDSEIQQLERVLKEQVISTSTVDTEAELFRRVAESLNASDEETIRFLKSLQQGLQADDSRSNALFTSLQEAQSLQAALDTRAELFRAFDNSFGLDDRQEKIIILKRILEETVGLEDEEELSLGLSVNQSLTVVDRVSSKAELFRVLQESFNLSDDEKAFLDKKLSEGLTLQEISELLAISRLSENVGTEDNVQSVANLFRSLAETFDLNDADIKQISQPLTESPIIDDSVAREGDLQRQLADSIVLQDDVDKALFKVLAEAVTLVDDREFALSKIFDESILVADELSKKLGKSLSEQVSIDDSSDFLAAVRFIESVDADDRVDRVADLFRDLNENLELDDFEVKELARSLQQEVITSDDASRDAELFRQLSEAILLNDEIESRREIFRIINEALNLSDNVESEAELFRNISQRLNLNELLAKELTRALSQSFTVSDLIKREIGKQVSETIDLNSITTSFKPANFFASEVEISKLQKAATNLAALRKAVAEVEKKQVSESDIDKL